MNRKLIKKALDYKGDNEYIALATVVNAHGSSPRDAGAQMLVYPDGRIDGTIGGGPIELETLNKAKELIKEGGNLKCHFDITNDDAAKDGGICGGEVEVFIETIKVN